MNLLMAIVPAALCVPLAPDQWTIVFNFEGITTISIAYVSVILINIVNGCDKVAARDKSSLTTKVN